MQIDEKYFKSEEFLELLGNYEAAINAGNSPFMDAEDLVDIADYYVWKGFEDKAETVIDYALELYPTSTLPNVFKARKALNMGDITLASSYFDNIENHDDPDYHYLKAEIMIADGDIEEADDYLRNYSKRVEPDEYEGFICDCANLYIDYGESEKAYEWMLRSRGDDSDDFKELMARALFGLEKFEDSIRMFKELLEHNPFSKVYWNALATAQYMNKEYAESITSAEFAIAIDPNDSEAINNKASGLFRMGNFNEALKYYEKYSELSPDNEYALFQQGICLVNMKRVEEALVVLRKALAVGSKDSEYRLPIYQELAFCYSAMHQLDQALEMIEKVKAFNYNSLDVLIVEGHILLENNQLHKAQEVFMQAIEQSHNSPDVMLRVIVSLYDNRYLNACYAMMLEFLKDVKEYYPNFKSGNAYMALCCYDMGRVEEFMKYLRLAVANDPQEATVVLSCLFPEGTPVSDFVKYMEDRIKL